MKLNKEQEQQKEKNSSSKTVIVSEKYSEVIALRALIQATPYIGGALDTLLASSGQKWRGKRIESLFQDLELRVSNLETPPAATQIEENEELNDLILSSVEQVARTRSEEKRNCFANLIVNQLTRNAPWDESEAAFNILARLTEAQLLLLRAIVQAPQCTNESFSGLRVVRFGNNKPTGYIDLESFFHDLSKSFIHFSQPALYMMMAELISLGLVKDEGIGRYGGVPMIYFVPTENADWIISWISEPNSKRPPLENFELDEEDK